ncbi:MAG: putative metallopeptidase [Lachnospiraceae bacterium]|nr:putative metallopeptidase [Lachnospiraceae bacterium]
MVETAVQSEEYAELAWEIIREQPSLQWIEGADVSIGFLESDKPKKSKGRDVLGECIRVRDIYKCFIPHDFLVVVYAPNVSGMSRDQLKILLYHELLHVGMDEKNGEPRYVVNPHDVEEFREILERHGLDWAKR